MAGRTLKIAAAATCASAAAGFDWNEVMKAFEKFQRDFDKKYEDAEIASRFGAFARNYAIIEEENAKGQSFKLAINEFADLTSEEFARAKLGYKPSGSPWGTLANLGVHAPSNITVPDTVDWTQKGAVNPIKNQGQCGSCWAFSAIGALEGAWEIATGKLDSFSEQQLVDCSRAQGNQGCSGGLMDNAFKYEEGNAVCTEASYGYTARGGTCQAATCTAGIPKGGVVGFKDVTPRSEQALMEAVAQQPVSVAIEADKSIFQLYSGGVLNGACGTNLDHGVVVVGYGEESGKPYWLVRNSWGAGWGLNGYVKIARGTGGVGMCGILSQPSYPVVKGSGPGPSPTPTPPAPSPTPTPPSSTHYEKPPCQSDEVDASIQGVDGEVCAPKCDASGACPTDKPAGTKATPQCMLQDSASGAKYCALSCGFDSGCPAGAKCAHVGLAGICVYPTTGTTSPKSLVWAEGQDAITV